MNEKETESLGTLLGPLAEIYYHPDIYEIFVDAYNNIYYNQNGKLVSSSLSFASQEDLQFYILKIFHLSKKSKSGYFSCRLEDGTIVRAFSAGLTLNGPAMSFTKLPNPQRPLEWSYFLHMNFLNQEAYQLLQKIVQSHSNILITGNAGSGRTTFANLLTQLIPEEYRLVVIEKKAEMIIHHKRCLRLEAGGDQTPSFSELIKLSPEMRGDYLILNPLEGAEAYEALNIMRSGQSVMASLYAESAADALKRLELMCLLAKTGLGKEDIGQLIASSLKYITFQQRLRDGKRVLSEIIEVHGFEGGKIHFTPLLVFDSLANGLVRKSI